MRPEPDENLVAFQILLPTSLLASAKKQAASLQIKSVGAYVRQLIAADLAKEALDAWGADAEPTPTECEKWEGTKFGMGNFLLQAVETPANGYMTARVRWRRSGGGRHTGFLSADALRSEFPAFGSPEKARRVLYLRGGTFATVESVMNYPRGALVTLKLHREYPASPRVRAS